MQMLMELGKGLVLKIGQQDKEGQKCKERMGQLMPHGFLERFKGCFKAVRDLSVSCRQCHVSNLGGCSINEEVKVPN